MSMGHRGRRRQMLLSYDHQVVREDRSGGGPSAGQKLRELMLCSHKHKNGIQERSSWYQLRDMGVTIIACHGFGFLGITFSFIACVAVDAIEVQLVDSSFFKATGLLLAVLLSLRAKTVVGRRQKLIMAIIRMINSARNIMEITSKQCMETHRHMRTTFCFVFLEVAAWVSRHEQCDPLCGRLDLAGVHNGIPKLEDLPAEHRPTICRLRGKIPLETPPRPLLLYLREICDSYFNPKSYDSKKTDEVSNTRRWHRVIDVELQCLTDQFDMILMYEEEMYTRQFRWLVDALIFIYIFLYPWCVKDESPPILGGTTLGMAFVFYGLNAMTQQLEDPFNNHGTGFNLALTFWKFFSDLDREGEVRVHAQEFMDRSLRDGKPATDALHLDFVHVELGRNQMQWNSS